VTATLSLSDPVMDYVNEAQPVHRALQRVLVQLSAFLLTQLGTRHRALCDRAPVEAARQALAECAGRLAALRVPARAAHHRRHLSGAAEALEQATLRALASDSDDDDGTFRALEEAERHLKTLARILPGFEAVDFTQACCAAHAGLAGTAADYANAGWVGEDDGRLFDLGAGLRCG
jgi:hypothetical protein